MPRKRRTSSKPPNFFKSKRAKQSHLSHHDAEENQSSPVTHPLQSDPESSTEKKTRSTSSNTPAQPTENRSSPTLRAVCPSDDKKKQTEPSNSNLQRDTNTTASDIDDRPIKQSTQPDSSMQENNKSNTERIPTSSSSDPPPVPPMQSLPSHSDVDKCKAEPEKPSEHPRLENASGLEASNHENGNTKDSKAAVHTDLTNTARDIPMEDAEDGFCIILFRCRNCNEAISDSTLGHEFDVDYANVFLEAVNNVTVCQNIDFLRDGPDEGCAYRPVSCSKCKAEMGRVYTSTPPELDHFRNRYRLRIEALDTYRLGRGRSTSGIEMKSKHTLNNTSDPAVQRKFQPAVVNSKLNGELTHDVNKATSGNIPPGVVVHANMQQSPSMALFSDLEMHVDTITNTLNSLTDVVKRNRVESRETRKAFNDLFVKVEEGQNALGHVHHLMLVWDDRLKEFTNMKEAFSKMLPMIHKLEHFRMVFEDHHRSVPGNASLPQITAPETPTGPSDTETQNSKDTNVK